MSAYFDFLQGNNLIENSSQLIYQSDVTKVFAGVWSTNVILFLFDHQLIFCKKVGAVSYILLGIFFSKQFCIIVVIYNTGYFKTRFLRVQRQNIIGWLWSNTYPRWKRCVHLHYQFYNIYVQYFLSQLFCIFDKLIIFNVYC